MHAIFFHYFKGERHIDCQGALTQADFKNMIKKIREKYVIVDATDFCEEYKKECLEKDIVSLGFSCGLKSQFDIALPVLEEENIKAFWMLYSKIYTDDYVSIEVYHHFRFFAYDTPNAFYKEFLFVFQELAGNLYNLTDIIQKFDNSDYLKWAPYYTYEDRLHKYIRDVIDDKLYDQILIKMMKKRKYNPKRFFSDLWINEEELQYLSNSGHVIGLHTHTHPYNIANLSYEEQKYEYETNKKVLEGIIGKKIQTMSHPCNSYNDDTLQILNELGIEYGFRSDMAKGICGSLEIPSEDHSLYI